MLPDPFFHLMPFGFIADGFKQSQPDIIIAAIPTQHGAEVGFFIVEQAGAKHPLGSQTQPVALVAKVMTDRTDKAQLPLCILPKPEHTGRSVCPAA
jgi:hypothetical protein